MSASYRSRSSVAITAIVPRTSSRRVPRHANAPVVGYGDGALRAWIVHHVADHSLEVGTLRDVPRSASHRVLDHLLGGRDLGHPAIELVGMVRQHPPPRRGGGRVEQIADLGQAESAGL